MKKQSHKRKDSKGCISAIKFLNIDFDLLDVLLMKKTSVLQVLIGYSTFTGVASYLYQQYSFMDRDKVHYDFLFCRKNS